MTRSIVRSVVRGLVKSAARGPLSAYEFITNGAFADATNWSAGTGWTIGSGHASHTPPGGGMLTQNFGVLKGTLSTSESYILSFDLVNPGGELLTVDLRSGLTGQVVYSGTGNGHIEVPFFASALRNTIRLIPADAEAIEVDNVSLIGPPP